MTINAIASERISLDPLVVADADRLASVLADPSVYAFTGDEPLPLDDLRRRFRSWERRRSPDGSQQWLNWTITLRATGDAIGYIQATIDSNGCAEIAYVIGARWQRQGYATEAARALLSVLKHHDEVREIHAHIAPGHLASEAVARAIGLHRTEEKTDEGEVRWCLDLPGGRF